MATYSKSNTHLDTLLEVAPLGVALLSRDLCFQYANPRLGTFLGTPHQNLIGRNHSEIKGINTLSMRLHLTSGNPEKFDVRVNQRDLEISSFPIQNGLSSVGMFVADVTHERQVEMELQQQLHDADAYAHTVAHNLKNSITNVIGSASLIQNYFSRMSAEDVDEQAGYIIESSNKLAEIVDSLLILASIEKQENFVLEPVDMFTAVEAATHRNAKQIAQAKARLHIPEEWPRAMGFTPWIEEVWANYLSNAIKYGGNPPVIQLGAEPLPNEGMIRFWIRDNGQGIPPEQVDRLFQPFTRLERRRTDGHGLGLSVVRRIVRKLGGTVGVRSKIGQGSEFSFMLPVAADSN